MRFWAHNSSLFCKHELCNHQQLCVPLVPNGSISMSPSHKTSQMEDVPGSYAQCKYVGKRVLTANIFFIEVLEQYVDSRSRKVK